MNQEWQWPWPLPCFGLKKKKQQEWVFDHGQETDGEETHDCFLYNSKK